MGHRIAAGRAAALVTLVGVGHGSGIEVSREQAMIYAARAGLVFRQGVVEGWEHGTEKLVEVASA